MDKRDKIVQKIQNLLDLASNNPSENEAKAALLKAQELMLRYHIENPETIDEDKVVTCFYDLAGRNKDEFVLMLSVVIANNFRCKTLHHESKICFIGFEADAKTAVQVYVFILNFADHYANRFFTINRNDKNVSVWYNGFIYGLHKAFDARAGYELMVQVPEKVKLLYDSLRREQTYKKSSNQNKTNISKAFMDGFNRGKESLDHREIQAK